MHIKNLLVLLSAAVAAAGLGFFASERFLSTPEPELITVLPEPRALPDFDLVDHRGEAFRNEAFEGQWDILFFGYTHCPDICPPTLSRLDQLVERLESQGEETPRIVFVTVDPERDTPDRLADYVSYFGDDFVGVTGDPGDLEAFNRSLGIVATKVPAEDSDAEYLVDHSGTLVVMDPDGHNSAVLTTPLAHEVETMVTDFSRLRRARGS